MEQIPLGQPSSGFGYLWVGRCPVLDVQAQGFGPAALTDQVCCIQSNVLVQHFIALEGTQRAAE